MEACNAGATGYCVPEPQIPANNGDDCDMGDGDDGEGTVNTFNGTNEIQCPCPGTR